MRHLVLDCYNKTLYITKVKQVFAANCPRDEETQERVLASWVLALEWGFLSLFCSCSLLSGSSHGRNERKEADPLVFSTWTLISRQRIGISNLIMYKRPPVRFFSGSIKLAFPEEFIQIHAGVCDNRKCWILKTFPNKRTDSSRHPANKTQCSTFLH